MTCRYFLFLLPFLFVAVPFSYADVTGYDYFDVINPDGTHTWTTHQPYIFDGTNYVPYISTGHKIETEHGSVILNANGTFIFYKKGIINDPPLFTDTIITKYADISNLTSWTYPSTLNNDTPDNFWDGSKLSSTKTKSGIGQLDYSYILDNGKWKTELKAKNLSSLNTKVFGFDEIINLNRDTIFFGGESKNLDNFNGTTFDKTWIDNNQGKIIDFLNTMYFDFDKSINDLYSITVYDTGLNSSRLVFDYRTSEILMPDEELILDPTFGYTAGTTKTIVDNSCDLTADSSSTTGYIGANSGPTTCSNSAFYWDISSLPQEDYITYDSVSFRFDTTEAYSASTICQAKSIEGNISTMTNQQIEDDIRDGTLFDGSITSACRTVANDYTLSNAAMLADLENEIGVDNEWGIGVYGANYLNFQLARWTNPELQINYTIPSTAFEVNISNENVGDMNSIFGDVTILDGLLVNITGMVFYIDGTPTTTNSTIQNTTSYPTSINFGPFYNQQTTDSSYNYTISVSVQDYTTATITNSSSSELTREYDPDYFTAIDPTQGTVNYTFPTAGTINVNRDKSGAAFNIECQYFTQAQAFFNELTDGTWDNRSSVYYYQGDTSGYYYVQCFNDGELFITAISQNFTNALVPGLVIFDQLGGFFGAPSIILVILSILSLGTGRNYPIIMLIAASVTGILLALELLTLDAGLIVALIVMTGFGLFGIRKFY